jgi:hypothetical protein
MLIVKDSGGAVFGVILTQPLQFNEDKYYGNGTICVFSFNSGYFQLYRAVHVNNYYLLSNKNMLAVGGGGEFAIYLDCDLNHGSSGQCATFDSPCLSSKNLFICVECELFAFQSPYI